jgi:hypothetical protein
MPAPGLPAIGRPGSRVARTTHGENEAKRGFPPSPASRSQQPRQILSLRSTAASSAPTCSISLLFSDGTSLECGWRWPTGALPINRVSCISDEGAVGFTGPVDDLAFPTVCAIAAGLLNRANNATVVIKYRMIVPPEISTYRCSRCQPTADVKLGRAALSLLLVRSKLRAPQSRLALMCWDG